MSSMNFDVCSIVFVMYTEMGTRYFKSSAAPATRFSSSKVARYRYRYFTTKVAALPATATLNNV